MMHQFIRWQLAPEIEGYEPPTLPLSCPQAGEYDFSMPFKWGDNMHFICNSEDLAYSSALTYGIGLINEQCENVAYSVGLYHVSEDKRQILFKLEMPNVPLGCYRLVWYKQVYEPIGEETLIDEDCVPGMPGYVDRTYSQEVTEMQRIPVRVSNPLTRIRQANRDTKILEYYDRRDKGVHFEFNYASFPLDTQRFRLPITIAEWQPDESDKVYRQTNGVFRRGNIFIDEGYTLRTEYFDRETHRALNNALSHAYIAIDGIQYFKFSAYKAEHFETALVPDRYHPNWIASCELRLQGYNQRNNACDYGEGLFKIYEFAYDEPYE
jgi:hypothetical protein